MGLVLVLAVLLWMLATRFETDRRGPVFVQTHRGVSCAVGAPYVDGGGHRPGYAFDRDCYPTAQV